MSDRIDTLNSRIAEVRSRLGALHSNINTASSASQHLTAGMPAPAPVPAAAFGQGQQQASMPSHQVHTSAGASAGFIADGSTYEHREPQGSVSPQAQPPQPPSTHHLSSVVGMTPNGPPSGATAHGAAAAAGIGLFPQTPSAQTFHGQTPSRPVPPPIPPVGPTAVGQTPHQQGSHHGFGYPQRDTAPRPPLAGHMGPHTSRGVAAPSPAVIDATPHQEHTGADQPSSSLPGGGGDQQQQQQQQQQSFFSASGTPHQYLGASPSAVTPGNSAAQPNSAFAALKQRLQLQQQQGLPPSSPPYAPPQPIVAAAAPRDPPPHQQFMDPAALAQQTQPLPHQTIRGSNHPPAAGGGQGGHHAAMPHHAMTMPKDTATAAAFFGAPTPQPLGSSGVATQHHQPQQHQRAPSSSTSPQGGHHRQAQHHDADGARGPSHEPASAPPAPTAAGGSFAEMQARLQSRLAQQMAEASAATQASVAAAHAPLSAPLAFDAVNQGQQQHRGGHHEQDHHHRHQQQNQQHQQVEQEPNALMRVHEASMSPSRDAQPPAPTPARPAGSLISGLVQGFSTPAQAGGQGSNAPRASNGAKTPAGKARPITPQRGNTAKGQAPTPARSSGSTTTKRKETSPPTGGPDADRATNGLKMARPVTAAGVQPVAVTGAEVFAILRLRGVITTDPAATSGEHLLPPAAVHTMLLTPSEVQQLNQLRIALRKQHPPPRPNDGPSGSPSPPPQQDSRSHSAQAADMYQQNAVPPPQPQHQQNQQPDPQSNNSWVRGGGNGGGPQRGEAPSFQAPTPSSKTPRQSRTPPRSQPAPSLRASEAALAAAERGKARRQAAGSSPAASSRWR